MAKNMPDVETLIGKLCEKDPRYAQEAYLFLLESVDRMMKLQGEHSPKGQVHLSVEQLLIGLCNCIINRFGPMSYAVLNKWGIYDSSDFGELVFNLIKVHLLGKSKDDKKEEFAGLFTLHEVFEEPYL